MKITARALLATFCITGSVCAQDLPQQTLQQASPQQTGAYPEAQECVILLHGLARTSKSMLPLEEQLRAQHYVVVNVDYPSRKFPIAILAEQAIPPALASCRQQGVKHIHFVTHSLGGILVRYYLHQPLNQQLNQQPSHPLVQQKIPELKRVVMLAPPNKGSEVVDNLKSLTAFGWLNGPAGNELGTDSGSLPSSLGPVDFDLGVIAGTTSINLLLSLYLPNPDDGKVSLENTKIEGMRDFMSLPVSHPFIMKDKEAITQIIYYLHHGKFLHPPATVDNKEL